MVLDGDERASLAVVRSLVAAGYAVAVAASRRRSIAGAARGARAIRLAADPLTSPGAYGAEVIAIAQQLGARLIIPVTDSSAEAMLDVRDAIPDGIVLPFASRDVYRAASDKVRVHEIACEVGIGIEETVIVRAAGEAAPNDRDLYPGVVKPHRSVVGANSRTKLGVALVEDAAECDAVLRSLPPEAFPVLVQRRVRGPGEGYFAARWGGRTIARFAHRRLREKPPAGGVSVFRESIALDAGWQRSCDALLDRLDWQGVAMVECKRDLDRGGWRAMEINGRFWGSLQLAIDAGVDFPRLLAGATLSEAVTAPSDWKAGMRLRWEWGDVDHLLIRMMRSAAELSLPSDAPSRAGAIAAFLTHRFGTDRLEVFRAGDPMPFVIESLHWFGLG